jgi:hypothetical protein
MFKKSILIITSLLFISTYAHAGHGEGGGGNESNSAEVTSGINDGIDTGISMATKSMTIQSPLKQAMISVITPDMGKNAANPKYQKAYTTTVKSINNFLSKKDNEHILLKLITYVKTKLREGSNIVIGSSSSFVGISIEELDKELGTKFVNVFQDSLKLNQ